ncbi:MAG: flagellar protein FliT [Betaproteobacteria bacterium]
MSGSVDALARYEEVALASNGMLEAARASDWDMLLERESRCAALIEALRAEEVRHELDERGLARKAAIIRRLLADDAEIRRLTQPWLRSLEQMLSASTKRQRLGDAYSRE